LSGLVKAAIGLNLADELGQGRLKNQHTYWLRQLLADNNEIEEFKHFRATREWYLRPRRPYRETDTWEMGLGGNLEQGAAKVSLGGWN
jgi:hypothetical protein